MRRILRVLASVAGTTLLVGTAGCTAGLATHTADAAVAVTSGSAHTYYVSPHGDDDASGTSPAHAWRSLARASRAGLHAGDSLLLARGGTWRGSLTVDGDGVRGRPVRLGAYGDGAMPTISGACVTLSGDWVVAWGLRTRGCSYAGFLVLGSHDTISKVVTAHNISGVTIRPGALHASVLDSLVSDNNRMAPNTPGPNDDYGAFGVEVQGSHAHVAGNLIEGSIAKSHDYGTDGSGVEIYGARGTVVDHNRSIGNLTFTELGKRGTRDSTFAYNLVRSPLRNGGFIVTRGVGDSFGPVLHTVAVHNTAVLTGTGSQDFWCGGVCDDRVLSVSDNVFEATARIGYAASRRTSAGKQGGSVGGGDNIFWGRGTTGGGVRRAPSDRVTDPRFSSAKSLRLRPDSPAIDTGTTIGPWTTDVYGQPLPVDGDHNGRARADVGAVEFQP